MQLFHRRTRTAYVYNGCLAWYNVVLTPRIRSSVKYSYCGKVLTSVTSGTNQYAHYIGLHVQEITMARQDINTPS